MNKNTVAINKNTTQFKCEKCGKSFSSKPALGMHNMRVHTRVGKAGWRKAIANASRKKAVATLAAGHNPDPGREHELQRRREYQRKLRERYFREGKNSRGEQMPPGWKPRGHYKRNKAVPIQNEVVQREPTENDRILKTFVFAALELFQEAVNKHFEVKLPSQTPTTKWHIA